MNLSDKITDAYIVGPTECRKKASKDIRRIYVFCVRDSNMYSTACGKLTSGKSGIGG